MQANLKRTPEHVSDREDAFIHKPPISMHGACEVLHKIEPAGTDFNCNDSSVQFRTSYELFQTKEAHERRHDLCAEQ
jgi:hypothetical protein